MSKSWQKVRLGEVLHRSDETVELQSHVEYREITVRLWGKGVVLRGIVTGAEVAASRRMVARQGQFILSRIDARNGALGIVPSELDGAIISNDFPVFNVIADRLLPLYLGWICKTAAFVEECQRASEGTTNRVRLQEDTFLTQDLTLPSLEEQRRIVARIEGLSAKVHEAQTFRRKAAEEAEILTASYLMHLFDGAASTERSQTRLGDVCSFHGGSQPAKFHFTYQPRDGYVRLIQIRDYKSDNYLTYVSRDSVRKFCSAEDVMIGRYGPPIFQILRGLEGAYNVALMKASPDTARLSKEFLFYLLKEPRLFHKVEEDSQRTSGQTGVRKELLEDHITFIPPLPEQSRIVADLDDLQQKADSLRTLQTESAVELHALMPSILDKAFRGELAPGSP
jgi:type I restriction enzyme S subunit